jgi:hypothetical protein
VMLRSSGKQNLPLKDHRIHPKRDARTPARMLGWLARITEPGFLYNGFWLVSMTRHLGVWNFTDRPATYNFPLCCAFWEILTVRLPNPAGG